MAKIGPSGGPCVVRRCKHKQSQYTPDRLRQEQDSTNVWSPWQYDNLSKNAIRPKCGLQSSIGECRRCYHVFCAHTQCSRAPSPRSQPIA
jgi:hypothetical protein